MANEQQRQQMRDIATQQLADIQALRRVEGFERYFMARLRQKRTALDHCFHHETPAVCSHEQRECYRQLLEFIDELLKMADQDEAVIKRTLENLG